MDEVLVQTEKAAEVQSKEEFRVRKETEEEESQRDKEAEQVRRSPDSP